ncbi:hypothetical protein BLNAU_15857 [Blattamonas nauphoetae]|uniref:Uncharacterized protein n=1 Tax=Blattamonas nauphoetae TaxID=2049346 RepID=A0ABQ9XEI9_9EUKA|nr:hypothetical protein BLNAU_15857 [Blattamonas nauphoetae]
MIYESLLSKVEVEDVHLSVIWNMADCISEWKEDEADIVVRGKIVLQTLEQEGFRTRLEQTLLHDRSEAYGMDIWDISCEIMNSLGMNFRQPE